MSKSSTTFRKLFRQCASRRDRECLCRVFKEVTILSQEFSMAAQYRELERANQSVEFMTMREIALAIFEAMSAMRCLGLQRRDEETRTLCVATTSSLAYVAGYVGLQDPRPFSPELKPDLSNIRLTRRDRDGDSTRASQRRATRGGSNRSGSVKTVRSCRKPIRKPKSGK